MPGTATSSSSNAVTSRKDGNTRRSTSRRQGLQKIAIVFDEEVEIRDDNLAQCAMWFRYMPHTWTP